ncbi:MAG: metallophosphoesterase [Planctomycetes bacterium]|nr:metallophosphoesterase [Planctomycetota bacterium]
MPRRLITRRRLLAAGLAAVVTPPAVGGYAYEFAPFDVQYHDVPLPIRDLPDSFRGVRIAHLTDLHLSKIVPLEFLRDVVDRVNSDKPDFIVVTGDLVTDADIDYLEPAADLLARLRPLPIVSFGNHDYGVYRPPPGSQFPRQRWTIDVLTRLLEQRRITALRNAAFALQRGVDRVWLVGLDDLWGGYFRPENAFPRVIPGDRVIALSHNPDTAPMLDEPYKPDVILAGHTHGGQVRIPFYGALKLPVRNKQFDQGMFTLKHSRMYVSRGVGYLKHVRLFCPPEVPTFVLESA